MFESVRDEEREAVGSSSVAARLREVPKQLLRSVIGFPRALLRALGGRRLVIALPFLVIAGMLWGETFAAPVPLLWLLPALVAALGVALWPDPAGVRQRAGVIVLFFGLGLALLPIHAQVSGTRLIDWPVYGLYLAHVDEVLDGGTGTRVVISEIRPLGWSRDPGISRARLATRGPVALFPGDRILVPVRFAPVPAPVLPGAFDTRLDAFFNSVGAWGTATKPPFRLGSEADRPVERFIFDVRQAIAQKIDRVLRPPEAGIARSLINGDQSAVDDDTRQTLATAGLAHVLSVSGLHLSIVAALALSVVRLLLALCRVPVPGKPVAAAVAILAALGYFALSGGNVAALRSTLMIVLVLGAVLFGRRALSLRNVAFAALLILFFEPQSLFRPGFQLSFAAVTGLIGAVELWPPRPARGVWDKARAFLVGLIVTSLVAGLATLPFSMVHFRQIAPLGILANLLGLPLVSFVTMPLAALSALAMPFGGEALPLQLLGLSLDGLVAIARGVSALGTGLGFNPLLSPLALVLELAGLAIFAIIETPHRLWGPLLVPVAVLGFALDRAPDVIIAESTTAVAVRSEAGLGLVMGKPESFAVNIWREAFLEPLDATPIPCDGKVCTGRSSLGFTYAIIKSGAPDDLKCPDADLIIARSRAPGGCAGYVIDTRLLRRAGTQLLYWNDQERRFIRRPAIPKLSRPWRAGQ